jgi:hypothetical protein
MLRCGNVPAVTVAVNAGTFWPPSTGVLIGIIGSAG